jgi:uncharacterized protein (DUF305 family)
MTRTTARLVRLAGGLIAGAVVLSGCSNATEVSDAVASSSSNESAENAAFNDADVTFVQGMIPHHRGALAMTQLADGRAEDPRVIDLASRIEAAQEPEIETMTAWLEEWDEPLPEDTMSEGMDGMDHGSGGMDMEGMSEEDMTALEGASGAEFDRMFLEMMIEHHQGAVEMAETEVEDGAYPDAIVLASEIADSQTAEIAEMETILSELGS